MSTDVRNIGLRDVIVADTFIARALSKIEPDVGKLIYRGYIILDLVKYTSYEETVYLLLYHNLPRESELSSLKEKMKSLRKLPEYVIEFMSTLPTKAPTMSVLQSTIPLIQCFECEKGDTIEETRIIALKLISLMSSLIATWYRVKNNLEPLKPSDLNHAPNFLYMLTGNTPDPEESRIFDECLILHAEHSFNASTFTARQVASTQASIYTAVSAAIGALSGQLHGGANEKVMDMLVEIGDIDNVEA